MSPTLSQAIALADSQAGATHGWAEFRPTGLLFYRDGATEAVFVPDPKASLRDVAIATGRAARAHFKSITALGMICAAWASRQAGADPTLVSPATAPDRKRARITHVVDVEGNAHVFTNVEGERHHEHGPVRDCEPIPAMLSQVLAEATFTSWTFCHTGMHERVPLL